MKFIAAVLIVAFVGVSQAGIIGGSQASVILPSELGKTIKFKDTDELNKYLEELNLGSSLGKSHKFRNLDELLLYKRPAIYQYASVPEPKEFVVKEGEIVVEAKRITPYYLPAPWYYPQFYIYPNYEPKIIKTADVIETVPGEAKFTAINRGEVYEAPLPGHSLSQTSVNLEPAPGTQ